MQRWKECDEVCTFNTGSPHSWYGEGRRKFLVKSEVLMVTSMKMAVFWDVAQCNLVDIDQHFRGAW
jgi:hypothetical protein